MKYTRRNFIKLGGLALGALPVLSNFGFGRVLPITSTHEWQSAEMFEKLIGSEFTIYSVNSAESTTLTSVRSYKTPDAKGECFSLEFELTSDHYEQNTYEMFHPSPGEFELFLVPGKQKRGDSSLIAVINRI